MSLGNTFKLSHRIFYVLLLTTIVLMLVIGFVVNGNNPPKPNLATGLLGLISGILVIGTIGMFMTSWGTGLLFAASNERCE